MACQAKHTSTERIYQPSPQAGTPGADLNVPLSRLWECTAGQTPVYSYVIASIRKHDGVFVQTGCGPNFEGGLITLCTCKHYMRTFRDPDRWHGVWIAGFTSLPIGAGANFLIYLMRVARAFASHRDLWFSTALPAAVKHLKAADRNRLGDLYQPHHDGIAPWKPEGYVPPCPDHCHARGWAKDVVYKGVRARPAALLVGDPHQSFLWNRPMIRYAGRLHRGQRKSTLDDLLAQLQAGELA